MGVTLSVTDIVRQTDGGGPSKNCTRIITPASRHVWRRFVRIIPPAPKLSRLTPSHAEFFLVDPRPSWSVR